MFGFAAAGAAAGSIALVIVSLAGGGIVAHVLPLTVVTFGLGVMMPAGFAGALAPHPEIAGTASSLIGFSQSMFAMVAGSTVGALFNGTSLPMSAMIAALTVSSLLSFLLVVQPFRRPAPAPRPAE